MTIYQGNYRCGCGEVLLMEFTETAWRVQHGPNPEHSVEGTRKGRVLSGRTAPPMIQIDMSCHPPRTAISGTWIDAVHARMRAPA